MKNYLQIGFLCLRCVVRDNIIVDNFLIQTDILDWFDFYDSETKSYDMVFNHLHQYKSEKYLKNNDIICIIFKEGYPCWNNSDNLDRYNFTFEKHIFFKLKWLIMDILRICFY